MRCEVPGCHRSALGPFETIFSVCAFCQSDMTDYERSLLNFVSNASAKRFGVDRMRWNREVRLLLKTVSIANEFGHVENVVSAAMAKMSTVLK